VDTGLPAAPSVTALVTNNTQPTLMGSATVLAGETLSVVVNGVTYTEGDGDLVLNPDGTWELVIPAANAVTEGVYNVDVSVSDTAGNTTTESTSGELIVDTTAPTPPPVAPNLVAAFDTGASDTDDITASTDNQFNVPPSTGTAGDAVVISANGTEIGTTTVAPDGSFVVDTSTLADGDYAITYTLTDEAGNTSVASPVLDITVDTVIADPTIDAPVAIDDIINAAEQGAILVTGTAEPNSLVELTLSDGVNAAVTAQATTDAAGNYTLLGNEADVSGLNEGTITITAQTTDIAGNTASSLPADVTLDNTAPPVPTVDTLVTNNVTPQLTGAVMLDPTDGFTVEVNGITYALGDSSGNLNVDPSGVWTLDIPTGNDLAEGQYDVVATVTDASGNSAADASIAELTIDVTAPVTPTVVSSIQSTNQPVINGTAVLAAGEELAVTVNGVTYTPGAELVLTAVDWQLTVPASNPVADGVYAVDAVVSDAAGNSTPDTTTNELTIDTALPTNPTVIAQTTNNTQPVIMGTATVLAGETLNVVVNGVTYSEAGGNLILNPDGTWELTIPPQNAVTEGVYNVDVTVTDSAGNTATESTAAELIIDTTAPTPPPIAPNLQAANDTGVSDVDDITSSTDNVFDVPASTGTAGDNVVLYADGVEIGTGVVAADGSFTIPASTLADGTYGISYTFTDSAGNTSVQSPVLTIEVDTTTTAPVIDQPIAIDDIVNAAEQTAVAITGTAEADSDVLVTLTDSVGVSVDQTVITDGNGVWTLIPLDVSSLTDGNIDVTADATDVAGNTATALPVSFLLDRAEPTIVINPIAVDDIINATEDNADVVINGSVTDVEDGQTVTITLNGKTYTTTVVVGTWSLDLLYDYP